MLSNLKIDVDQIRTFVCAAEHGSISRAAEAMGVSPSTVNSRIRALGKELDANLMERSGKGVALTPKGELLLGYLMRALDLLEEGAAEVKQLKSREQPALIAADAETGAWFLPQVMTLYREKYPEVRTNVLLSDSSIIIDWVMNGKVDIGLVRGPVAHKGVKAAKICSSPVIPVFSPRHPLADKEVLTARDLAAHRLIAPGQPADEWERIRQWFARQKTAFPQAVTADHPETVKQFVYRDIGYTFSPLLAVQEDVKSGRLRTSALRPALPIHREAYMVSHRSLPMREVAAQFRDYLLQAAFAS
jgi:Transcriptional regulator